MTLFLWGNVFFSKQKKSRLGLYTTVLILKKLNQQILITDNEILRVSCVDIFIKGAYYI